MKIILGNPGSGKTKKILQLSAENNIPILCESKDRFDRLVTKARGYGFIIPEPIIYTELTENIETVYVDDVQRLLEGIFNLKIEGITINTVDKTEIDKI